MCGVKVPPDVPVTNTCDDSLPVPLTTSYLYFLRLFRFFCLFFVFRIQGLYCYPLSVSGVCPLSCSFWRSVSPSVVSSSARCESVGWSRKSTFYNSYTTCRSHFCLRFVSFQRLERHFRFVISSVSL